jgi:AraC-like DNA-binding protein
MTRLKTGIRSPRTEPPAASSSGETEALRAAADNGALRTLLGERRLHRVLQMIDSEPSCSVSDLALEVHLSPAHLQRLFKQKAGLRVSDLIGEHRLQKAARLLSTSEMPIKEIAYAVGYEHHSSFVRAFHRRFAQSPRGYRQQNFSAPSDSLQMIERAAAD